MKGLSFVPLAIWASISLLAIVQTNDKSPENMHASAVFWIVGCLFFFIVAVVTSLF